MPNRPQQHRPPKPSRPPHEDQRPSACKRGYDRNWRKLRDAYAAVHPAICVDCGYAGPSREMHLDHQVPKPIGTDDWANLRWMCQVCHNKKTVREDGALGRPIIGRRFVICGPPGSGKTTYVDSQRQTGELVWDADAIVHCMTGLPMHEFPADLFLLIRVIRDAIVEWVARSNAARGLWIITGNAMVAAEASKTMRARLIVMSTEKEECLRRLQAAGRLDERAKKGIEEWSVDAAALDNERTEQYAPTIG